jgi:ligand-binding sensor domain-containing protein
MNIFKHTEIIKNPHPFIFLWLIFSLANPAASQTLKFDRLNIEDGLSQNAVQCIIQDDNGFIWIGTQDGLNRFDGYEFKVFKHNSLDSASLSENYIQTMLKDHTGIIWIGTINGGLEMFDPATEKFTHFLSNSENEQSLSSDIVISLLEDKSGTLWIGTYGGGLNKYDREQDTFTHYKNNLDDPKSISNNIVLDIFEDSEGDMWVGTMGGGLDKFDRESGHFNHYRNEPGNTRSLSHNSVWEIKEDKSGILWIGTMNGGLNKFDKKTGFFFSYLNDPQNSQSLNNNVVQNIYVDKSGILWIGTREGINLFNTKSEIFTMVKSEINQREDLSDYMIQDIFEDDGGIIWISSFGGGVFKYDPHRLKFKHYKHEEDNPNSLSNNQIYAIQGDPGNTDIIWIGTFGGGLNKFNSRTGKYTHYQNQPGNTKSLSSNHIQVIYFDHAETMWVGTVGNGLNRFDQSSNTFTRYQHDPNNSNTISSNRIRSIYEDRNKALWIGTYGGGINIFDRKTGQFSNYKNQSGDSTSLSNDIAKVIFEDSKGRVWIGTLGGGLNLFDRTTKKFTRFMNNPQNPKSISNNVIQCIYENNDGILWISTYGGGLNRYDSEQNTFDHFTEEDGLPHNSLYDILPDDNGNLWISTSRGLTKFNPGSKTFRNYDTRDGLQGEDFNSGAYYKSETGEMFFGGLSGFNSFHPDSIRNNPHVPPIVITNFQKFNKNVQLNTPIHHINQLELTYKDYVFSFEFAALDFAFPDKNRYAYMMDGFENEWNYSRNRRFVTYTNLDPGEYIFRVKGSNNDGIWDQTGTALAITIAPPFWKTWWFTSLSGGLILILIILIINRIKSREQKMAEIDRKISDLKMKALASQMKPHFVFNIINAIQYLISNNEQKAALDYMSKFAKLLRLSLDNSLKSTISITDELKFLNLYLELEQFRFENNFDYKIQVDSKIDSDNVEIPIMCIQPVVENAVIHGLSHSKEKGDLNISFFCEEDKLFCKVKDNGPGINRSLQLKKFNQSDHQSLGMKITEERLRLLLDNSSKESLIEVTDLGDDGKKESGTLVKMCLPIALK